jgi:hypothetical protein
LWSWGGLVCECKYIPSQTTIERGYAEGGS